MIEANDVVIRNNIVGPNQRWGIFSGFSPNILVENNKTFGSVNEHGIYLSNSRVPHDHYVVRGNESYGNHASGIQLNGDCKSLGTLNASDGILEDCLIENNVVHDNQSKALSIASAPGIVIRNNLIYNNGIIRGAGGIHLASEPGCKFPSNDAVVLNNTIVEPKIAAIRTSDGTSGAVIFNNILISARPMEDEDRGKYVRPRVEHNARCHGGSVHESRFRELSFARQQSRGGCREELVCRTNRAAAGSRRKTRAPPTHH